MRRLAAVACILHACGDPSHIYEGQLFRTDRDCLGTPSSVDVVSGDDPGICEAKCLVQTNRDGTKAYYVSTMCPPYPHAFDATGTDPVCPRVLAAFQRNDTCFVDGGSAAPLPRDGGAD